MGGPCQGGCGCGDGLLLVAYCLPQPTKDDDPFMNSFNLSAQRPSGSGVVCVVLLLRQEHGVDACEVDVK